MIHRKHIPFERFASALRQVAHRRLPGIEAQLRMAPALRRDDIRSRGRGGSPVPSSVLVVVYPGKSREATTVLIRRPAYDGVHSGQISFPGGRYEQGDGRPEQTALRETQEEIGIAPDKVDLVGRLSDLYIPPSNYLVTPIVGLMKERPVFRPDPKEVAGIIEVPVITFYGDNAVHQMPIAMSDGQTVDTPCYLVGDNVVWGATAMILSEFTDFTREATNI